MVAGGIITLVIISPLLIHRRVTKYWWQWKWAKIAVSEGLTQADIDFAVRCPDGTPNGTTVKEMIAWFEQIKQRGKSARKISS